MKIYNPSFIDNSIPQVNLLSAWVGLEKIIKPILKDFNISPKNALEIGVDYGYSLWQLSEIFENTTGVDIFEGDIHAGQRSNQYEIVLETFKNKKNVKIIKKSYQEFFKENTKNYNLIHIDIVHTFIDTYTCGLLASEFSNCIIFHDTESFPDVKKACIELSNNKKYEFYNYPFFYGLGILIK